MIVEPVRIVVEGRTFDNIESGLASIERDLNEASDRATVRAGKEIIKTLNAVGAKIRSKHSQPWNGGVVNFTNRLQRRSGGGLRSILESIRMLDNTSTVVAGEITTGNMAIHETGGVIRAKRARYLTIPLPSAMDSRGVPLHRRAREWNDTFVARSRNGTLLIFQKRLGRVVPLYILKPSVFIPARLGMEKTFNDQISTFERRAFEAIAKELER